MQTGATRVHEAGCRTKVLDSIDKTGLAPIPGLVIQWHSFLGTPVRLVHHHMTTVQPTLIQIFYSVQCSENSPASQTVYRFPPCCAPQQEVSVAPGRRNVAILNDSFIRTRQIASQEQEFLGLWGSLLTKLTPISRQACT